MLMRRNLKPACQDRESLWLDGSIDLDPARVFNAA
jgi:hypothetical protein